jgi:hypothetical protein
VVAAARCSRDGARRHGTGQSNLRAVEGDRAPSVHSNVARFAGRARAPRRVAVIVGAWTGFVFLVLAAYAWIVPNAAATFAFAASVVVFVTPVVGILAAPLAVQAGRVR